MGAKSKPAIGAHVSAAGGLQNAVMNATAIGAAAVQIFGSSPRTWSVRMPPAEDAAAFRTAREAAHLSAVYLHAAYLANLASISDDIYMKSVGSLTGHLKIAGMIGADGLIFHIGSSKGGTREDGLGQILQGMERIISAVPATDASGRPWLVMENTAGGGERIGSGVEEMHHLLQAAKSPRVKICLDTAHAFESGLLPDYRAATIAKFFDSWEASIGMEPLVAIHANDSKTAANSHHDRHENIGEGFIGLAGFRALAGERRLWDKPWLLEVPGFEGTGPDKKNVDLLRSCFDK